MVRKSKLMNASDNVFADLGLEDAQELYAKAHLVMLIGKMIEEAGLTQAQAGAKVGLKQPDVSKLLKGRFDGFSFERLLHFIRALGSDVEITIKPAKRRQEGRIHVTA